MNGFVLTSHRSSGGSAGGLLTRALGCVGGAGVMHPLPADGGMRVRHGHAGEHLVVLQLVHPLQNHVHASHHRGHVSTNFCSICRRCDPLLLKLIWKWLVASSSMNMATIKKTWLKLYWSQYLVNKCQHICNNNNIIICAALNWRKLEVFFLYLQILFCDELLLKNS